MSHPPIPKAFATTAGNLLARLGRACDLEALRAGPIVVGVSGGADSVGLLHALVYGEVLPPERSASARTIVVAHAEHDLRDDAGDDREFVAAIASGMGVEAVTRRIACREAARGSGEGLEACARRLRYAFLTEVAGSVGARAVLVAHTADDQAETILHAALRGTGLVGLAGMPVARELVEGIALVRPMLEVGREEVREYLRAAGQPWREDATNADIRFARNFLRHEILAKASEGPYPAAAAALGRLGRQAAAVAAAIESAAQRLLDVHGTRRSDGWLLLDARALGPLDRHLLAEVFVAVWKKEDWPRRDMTARHYASLASLLAGAAGGSVSPSSSAIDLPGGVRAVVEDPGRLRIGRA